MNGDEYDSLPQTPQQSSANANTPYNVVNSGPLPGGSSQPRILLPGQEAITPTTYSDNTVPLNLNSLSSKGSQALKSPQPLAAPKSEPIGASILDPTIPAAYPNSVQIGPSLRPAPSRIHFSKEVWWIAGPVIVAVTVIVLALLIIPVSAFWQAQNATKSAAKSISSSQPTTTAPSPVPTQAAPTAIPTPTATTSDAVASDGVSITPGSFNVQNDCQPDNGYRCTITLALAADAEDAVSWSASLDGVDHSFHPRRGRLEPGQQQQIIVYLYDSCPINATFDVAVKHQHLTVPLQCS